MSINHESQRNCFMPRKSPNLRQANPQIGNLDQKQSTLLQSYLENPTESLKSQRPKISIPQNQECSFELKLSRCNTPLKKQINANNSAFSDLSTNSSTSTRSTSTPKPTRDSQYKKAYVSIKHMFLKQPKMENCLRNCQVTQPFRTKMVNWMFEVFQKFEGKTCDKTLFRAIMIMDLFFKHHRSKVLTNSDVYLTGLTSIFIASKYSDVSNITLEEFAHYKVSKDLPITRISEFEYTILTTLGFEIYFPVVPDFLDHYCQLFLDGCPSDFAERVRFFCVMVAKMCILNVEFNNINFEGFALTILLFVVKFVDCGTQVGSQSFHQSQSKISGTTKSVQGKIAGILGIKAPIIENCVLMMKAHMESFHIYYKEFDNVFRFHDKFQMRLLGK